MYNTIPGGDIKPESIISVIDGYEVEIYNQPVYAFHGIILIIVESVRSSYALKFYRVKTPSYATILPNDKRIRQSITQSFKKKLRSSGKSIVRNYYDFKITPKEVNKYTIGCQLGKLLEIDYTTRQAKMGRTFVSSIPELFKQPVVRSFVAFAPSMVQAHYTLAHK